MGQQQLLLIVLGVIIVGIAVILGLAMFRTNSIEQKRDQVINEGISVANNALQYYNKPKTLGGGGYSFNGWSIPNQMKSSPNGSFVENVGPNSVEIIGTGNEMVSGTDSVKVKFVVTKNGIVTTVLR